MLEIALATDGAFTYVLYGTLTVCFLTARWNAGDVSAHVTIRHEDEFAARLVFDWATKTV